MADSIRINGNVHSWSSVILKIAGESFTGITSIAYGDKRERIKAYGMGRHHAPRGRSRGKYTTDPVKMSVQTDTAETIRNMLAQLSSDGVSIGDVSVQIVLQFVESGNLPMNIVFEDCVSTVMSGGAEESADPTKEEWEWDTMKILRNGRTLFDSSRGAP